MTITTTDRMSALIEFYGEPISVYTRAQALADGALVDVSELAREAGYIMPGSLVPVAMTAAAYADLAAWTADDEKRKSDYTGNDTTGRLWDVFSTMRGAARTALAGALETGSSQRMTSVYRIKREGRGTQPRRTPFLVHAGGDDNGAPCLTIMLPHES